MPARDAGHPTQGRMPAPGWKVPPLGSGVQPYAATRAFLNPERGIWAIPTTRRSTGPSPSCQLSTGATRQRIQRWLALMKAREVHTRESFIEAQLDTVNPTARNCCR
jgi:penicillin amidase